MGDQPRPRRFTIDELRLELSALSDGDELALLAERLLALRVRDAADVSRPDDETDRIWELVRLRLDEVSSDPR